MPRYARLHYPGGVFHVISRCLNHEHLIQDAADRQKYLDLLGSTLERTDATLLAWCLMSNHVHLVVRAGDQPLERLVKPLHTGYAGWKNRKLRRIGPVFAGRFKSPLVDAESYLLELVRYVHNNPVRAGLVPRAEDSTWSSQRAYLGVELAPPWLKMGEVLGRFHARPERARQAFAAFVTEGGEQARRPELSGARLRRAAQTVATDVGDSWRLSQPIVGDDAFAEKVLADLRARDAGVDPKPEERRRRPELEELLAYTSGVVGVDEWEFWQQPKRVRPRTVRMIVTWLWVQRFGGTQAHIARSWKAHSSMVSSWYGTAVRRLPDLEPLMDEVLRNLPEAAPEFPWTSAKRVHYHLATEEDPLRGA